MRFEATSLMLALSLLLWWPGAYAGSVANEAYVDALERDDVGAAARLIHQGVNLDAQRADGKTLLILAAKYSDVALVRSLVAAGADVNVTTNNGGTALMFAAIQGDLDTVQVLVNAGVDVNAIGGFDWTALMVASVKGHGAVVRLLIREGADANLADVYGWTPLMRAAYEGRRDVVQALLEWPQIDSEARNDQGARALHHAAAQGNETIVRLLLAHGANPMPQDRAGRTPLNMAHAGGHGEVARLLQESE